MTIPGYPNYFTMLGGGNVAPAHCKRDAFRQIASLLTLLLLVSVIYQLEVQAEYIAKCIAKMRSHNIPVLEVKQAATEAYNV